MAGQRIDSSRINEMSVDLPPAYSGNLEGNMEFSSQSNAKSQWEDLNTLDEPIRDTVFRDVKAIAQKFFHVLIPRKSKALLRDWDLWGPLILTTLVAMMLQGQSAASSKVEDPQALEFATTFLVLTVGAVIVTLNSKLLGGNISFFQSVCILGYCLLPPVLALIGCKVLSVTIQSHKLILFILRTVLAMVAFIWATFASLAFLGDTQLPNRKSLAVYPIFLFYLIISWLIIINT